MPSLGLLIGLPITILIVLVCALLAVFAYRIDSYDGAIIRVPAVILGVVTIVFTAFAFFPYQHDYHFWTNVTGNVSQVSKRLVSNGDSGMQEKIVLVVNGQPYGVSDTRATLVKPGDRVSLNCKKSYEFNSTSGWDCRWKGVAG